jgi:hypothetical protein
MKHILALIVLMIIAAGCVAEQQAVPAEIPPAEPVPAAVPVPEPAAEERPPAADDGTAERLAREQEERILETLEQPPKLAPRDRTTIVEQMWETYSALDSYQFRSAKGMWYVRGEKVRFLPVDAVMKSDVMLNNKMYRQVLLDELVFDTEERTLTGYCFGFEESVNNQCANLELHDIAFPLTYGEFMIKLPHEWAREYLTKTPIAEEHEKYYVKNIETIRVRFEDGTEMYFFARAGLPVKIVRGTEITSYDGLVVNQVRPEDVIHRSKKDIPASEAFSRTPY